jgi:hypothetical protein
MFAKKEALRGQGEFRERALKKDRDHLIVVDYLTCRQTILKRKAHHVSRVDYGRRAASQPSVSRSPSPNRTYPFCYVSGSPEATAYLSYTAEHVSLHAGDRP